MVKCLPGGVTVCPEPDGSWSFHGKAQFLTDEMDGFRTVAGRLESTDYRNRSDPPPRSQATHAGLSSPVFLDAT